MNKLPQNVDIVIAKNKKAYFNYAIDDEIEAGIVLLGTEVKSLRLKKASIEESHIGIQGNEAVVFNLHIPVYQYCRYGNHKPDRIKKLLLHRRQINKLQGLVKKKGVTIIPLLMYFNKNGIAKLKVGVGVGKKLHDKREELKRKELDIESRRAIKEL